MRQLEYPFNSKYLLTHKKKIKKELSSGKINTKKRLAILGGSTTFEIKEFIEMFLLNIGIELETYESPYNCYLQEGLFPSEELIDFKPDYIYIYTSTYNINEWPEFNDTKEDVNSKIETEYNKYLELWNSLKEKFPKAIILQNNFAYLPYRLLGNMDTIDYRGKNKYIKSLNNKFNDYKETDNKFYIVDIHYISAGYGLDKWYSLNNYYLYKYAMDSEAVPLLSFNVANIIKALCGKNKKAIALDLDNTLWGGVIGDDGVEHIKLGVGDALGEAYLDFHRYLKSLESQGIPLNIVSKNEYENALLGLSKEESLLKEEDFVSIKANWEPKNQNLINLANEMGLTPDAFVFIDDNPMERDIVSNNIPNISVPEIEKVCEYVKVVDHNGFFETTTITDEDKKRNKMYKSNVLRNQEAYKYEDYNEYLKNLEMVAKIGNITTNESERVSQLSQKSNQFNLTTKRYDIIDIERLIENPKYINLYGKLEDKFGDNGLVTVVIGNIEDNKLNIDLWIQSCRVLKRNLEFAMLDSLVDICKKKQIKEIYGYYYPTPKNKLVVNFYDTLGFELIEEDEEQNRKYLLKVDNYENKNNIIEVDYNE